MRSGNPEGRRSRARTLTLASGALAALASAHLPAQQPYENDAHTVALYRFDVETVASQLKRITPDSGPYGLHGRLEGEVLPAHVPAGAGGFGRVYQFDGVDRGVNSGRINMGTDQALALRGNANWTLDVRINVAAPLDHEGSWQPSLVCRTAPVGVDYELSYWSYTNLDIGPIHGYWFGTGDYYNGASPNGLPPQYSYVVGEFPGLLQPGQAYDVRVVVQNGVITLTENGATGITTLYPLHASVIPPTAAPVPGELTVGGPCPQDGLPLPSRVQIDELRISNVARTN